MRAIPQQTLHYTPPVAIAPPIIAWIGIMISALALPAFHVRLWARMDEPIEHLAIYVMIATQFTATALLFPWLMRDPRVAGLIIFSCPLMLMLAGWLSDSLMSRVGDCTLSIVLWTSALSMLSRRLVTSGIQLIGVAIVGTAVVGGMVLLYLQFEFANLEMDWPHGRMWITPGLVLWIVNGMWMIVGRLRR